MAEGRSFVSRAVSALALIALGGGVGAGTAWYLRNVGPEVDLLTPTRAHPGDVVTLKGLRFAPAPQGVIVLFGDQTGPVVKATADEIRVGVPARALEGPAERHVAVRVLIGDRASAPVDLTVYAEAPVPPVSTAQESAGPAATPTTLTAPPAPTLAPRAVEAARPPATAAAAPPSTTVPRPTAVAQASIPPARTAPVATPAPPVAAATHPAAEPAKPPPAPEPVVASSPHTFVLERSAAVNNKRAGATLAGFDATGVDLKRAPEVPGRVDFEIMPSRVKAGDRYTVTAFLINDGSKGVRIKEMFVATTRNGVLSAAPVPPKNREVSPRQRQVIGVFSDVWSADVVAWTMDITVTSDRADVYKNQVTWK
jgi:hypothetical protein